MENTSNIINLVRRIAKEAETVEDMEKLLISELDAYEVFKSWNIGNITLYDESRIEGTRAIVGNIDGYSIALHQKMIGNQLKSYYNPCIKVTTK